MSDIPLNLNDKKTTLPFTQWDQNLCDCVFCFQLLQFHEIFSKISVLGSLKVALC